MPGRRGVALTDASSLNREHPSWATRAGSGSGAHPRNGECVAFILGYPSDMELQTAISDSARMSTGVYRAMVDVRAASADRALAEALEQLGRRMATWANAGESLAVQAELMNEADVPKMLSEAAAATASERGMHATRAREIVAQMYVLIEVAENGIGILDNSPTTTAWLTETKPRSSGTARKLAKEIDASAKRAKAALARLKTSIEEQIDIMLVVDASLDPENDGPPIPLAEVLAGLSKVA
jgi:hypothetical protein